MNSSSKFHGWSKLVLGERNDGVHEWLTAIYLCRTAVEAITLESCHSPTSLMKGSETLKRKAAEVYEAFNGQQFVVFDWRLSEHFLPMATHSAGD